MKIQIKIYIAPKNWRLDTITIPDKFEELKEWRDDDYWEDADTDFGPNLLDELHEWIFEHLSDRIGTTGFRGDGKQAPRPAMFRIFNVFV